MKIKKNWKLWGLIFVCFVVVWIGRALYLSYYLRVERVKSEYELEVKRGLPREDMGERFKSKSAPPLSVPSAPTVPSAPITTPKEPVDVWGWIVKIGGALSGLKTLLDIIDKLKSRIPKSIIIPTDVPEGTKVTVIVVIEKLASKLVKLLLSPIRLFKR